MAFVMGAYACPVRTSSPRRCGLSSHSIHSAPPPRRATATASLSPSLASSRRSALHTAIVLSASTLAAIGASVPDRRARAEERAPLCDDECVAGLENIETVSLPSGLRYQELKEGEGASPLVGFQVVVDYVARVADNGKVFRSTLGGRPSDVRYGTGDLIPGVEEGLKTMKSGGVRRLYIPGKLAFPNGLASSPGTPRVAPGADVVFDLRLVYVPGIDE